MIYTDPVSHLGGVPCRMSPEKQHCASRPAVGERKGEGWLVCSWPQLIPQGMNSDSCSENFILSLDSVAQSGSRSGRRASSCRKGTCQFVEAAPPRPAQRSLPWPSQVRAKQPGVQESGEGLKMGLLHPQRPTGLA